jgi:hypothetical protein
MCIFVKPRYGFFKHRYGSSNLDKLVDKLVDIPMQLNQSCALFSASYCRKQVSHVCSKVANVVLLKFLLTVVDFFNIAVLRYCSVKDEDFQHLLRFTLCPWLRILLFLISHVVVKNDRKRAERKDVVKTVCSKLDENRCLVGMTSPSTTKRFFSSGFHIEQSQKSIQRSNNEVIKTTLNNINKFQFQF